MNFGEFKELILMQSWFAELHKSTQGRILWAVWRLAMDHVQKMDYESFSEWKKRAKEFDLSFVTLEEAFNVGGIGPRMRELLRKAWPLLKSQSCDFELELAKHEWC